MVKPVGHGFFNCLISTALFALMIYLFSPLFTTHPDSDEYNPTLYASLLLLWPIIPFFTMGMAYTFSPSCGVKLIGKNVETGQIPCLNMIFFLPYVSFHWFVWWFRHTFLLTHEDPYNRITESIYLGRYPKKIREFPDDATMIVDVTCEFPARSSLLVGRQYICIPALDQLMPSVGALLKAAKEVKRTLEKGGIVYVHCANGRGRSSCLLALVALIMNKANSVDEALATLKQNRPQVKTELAQRIIVDKAWKAFTGDLEGSGVALTEY